MQDKPVISSNYQRPYLSKRIRWFLWGNMWIILVNVALSSGIMSSGGKTIKAQLRMMDLEYGCFTALYAIGRMIGSLLFVTLINVVNRKYLIFLAVFFKSFTVIIFKYVNDGYFLLGIRLLSGIGHIFPVIYGPIWVDQLCIQKYRYVMMSGFSIAGAFGRSCGFIIDYFIGSDNWRNGFVGNGIVLLVCSLNILFIPNIYFSSKLVAMKGKEGEEQLRPSQARVVSIFNVRESDPTERDINICKKYWIIFSNPVYIFCLLARVVINSITAVLQFWIPSYLTEVIGYTNREIKLAAYVFMICCLPFTGSFLGGYAASAVGGYANKHSLVIVLMFNLFACIVFAPMPFMNEWYSFLICCGAFQVCGSAVLPTLNGIILSSIPPKLKANGYAFANIAGLLFGSVPSPVIYGLLNDKWKSIDKRYCMKFFTVYSFIGLLWIIIAVIFRYRAEEKDMKKEPFKSDNNPAPQINTNINDNLDMELTMKINEEQDQEDQGRQLRNFK